MKTTICEKKSTLDGVDGRRHDGELEDMVTETSQNKTQTFLNGKNIIEVQADFK